MNCEHCKLPRDRLHDCMHSLMDEVARLKSVAAEFHNIDDVVEIRRLKQQFSLAEEGLAKATQENERLRKQLSARLQELERIKRKRLDWAMLCDHDCPACTELDDAIRGDVPQEAKHE